LNIKKLNAAIEAQKENMGDGLLLNIAIPKMIESFEAARKSS
jgi:hypothetical protein